MKMAIVQILIMSLFCVHQFSNDGATAHKINRRDTSCYSIGFGGCADGGCYKDMGGTGYCTNMGSRILPNCQCVYGKRLLKLILLSQNCFYLKS